MIHTRYPGQSMMPHDKDLVALHKCKPVKHPLVGSAVDTVP